MRLFTTIAVTITGLVIGAHAAAAQDAPRYVVNLVALQPGVDDAYREMQSRAAAFWDKHGITVVARFAVHGPLPAGFGPVDHVEVFRIDDMADFRAYVGDPEYQPIRESRPDLRRRAVAISGEAQASGAVGPSDAAWFALTLDAAPAAAVPLLDLAVGRVREGQGAASDAETAATAVALFEATDREALRAVLGSATTALIGRATR